MHGFWHWFESSYRDVAFCAGNTTTVGLWGNMFTHLRPHIWTLEHNRTKCRPRTPQFNRFKILTPILISSKSLETTLKQALSNMYQNIFCENKLVIPRKRAANICSRLSFKAHIVEVTLLTQTYWSVSEGMSFDNKLDTVFIQATCWPG